MFATITLLPGDGIGPEVVDEGVRVLQAIGRRFNHTFGLQKALIGGCAIDATGSPLPNETLELAHKADAVLLGAVGGPKWDDPEAKVRPEQGLLGIRKALGLFANLRPVTVYPQLLASSPLQPSRLAGVDMIVVRELTGGIYFGEKGRERLPNGQERAYDVCDYTTEEIERVVRTAAVLARSRRKKLTSVDKANVLETSRLWRSVTTRLVREEFPDIELEHTLVDAFAMHLLRRPGDFDIVVTENMFGDILTDEASMLAGSMGMLPSASLGAETEKSGGNAVTRMGLYEPIHGSAPDIAGKGIANPMATVLSVAMLLRYSLGLTQEAKTIEDAVAATLDAGIVTGDVAAPGNKAYTTTEVGQAIADRVAAQ
jgi:3-isopropylmalate dehydrogenase